MNNTLKVSVEFSSSPGPRYIKEGNFSGELFRKTCLAPRLVEAIGSNFVLNIDLDGTAGYGTSFLEESFGGLIREENLDLKQISNHINLISNEEEYLIEDIKHYLQDASNKQK